MNLTLRLLCLFACLAILPLSIIAADKAAAFLTVAEYGDPADQATRDRAAKEAFAHNVPLWLDAGTGTRDGLIITVTILPGGKCAYRS